MCFCFQGFIAGLFIWFVDHSLEISLSGLTEPFWPLRHIIYLSYILSLKDIIRCDHLFGLIGYLGPNNMFFFLSNWSILMSYNLRRTKIATDWLVSIYLCPSHLGPTSCTHLSIDLSVKAYLVAGQNIALYGYSRVHLISDYLSKLYCTILELDLHVRAYRNVCHSHLDRQVPGRDSQLCITYWPSKPYWGGRYIRWESTVASQIPGKSSILHQCSTHAVTIYAMKNLWKIWISVRKRVHSYWTVRGCGQHN